MAWLQLLMTQQEWLCQRQTGSSSSLGTPAPRPESQGGSEERHQLAGPAKMAAPAGGPTAQGNRSLHRDVLKWVQSLDLALPVKNPRRDFANGVLVAQIYSRTYEADISMHGFQNGNSLKVKRDNWAQLKRCVGCFPGPGVARTPSSAVACAGCTLAM